MSAQLHSINSRLNQFWVPVWFRFAVVAVTALMAGFIGGERWGLLVALFGLLVLIGFHLYYLKRVNDWLNLADREELPELPSGFGAWQTVFQELRRARKRDDRRRAEVAETLDRFIQASSALPDGIVILDRADRIEWCNPSASDHLGLSLARDGGFLLANLVRQPAFTEYLVRADFREPLQMTDHTGTRQLSLQFLPFQDTRRILLTRDITRLVQVESMRRDFIANVSHELRTPITVVSGFLEQFEDQPDTPPDQRKRIHAVMLEQSRRMQRLVEDLLSLSRLESQPLPTLDETFSLASILGPIVDEARALSQDGHQIELSIPPGIQIAGVADELRSAIGNLVSNAVRYTPKGGTVRIAFTVGERESQLAVSDSGPGIAAEHLPRLTERFYRVDKSRSRETGGTGLGLAIVKHALVRHGGRLEVESIVGKGSTFKAILPYIRVLAPAAAPGSP